MGCEVGYFPKSYLDYIYYYECLYNERLCTQWGFENSPYNQSIYLP